MIEVLGSVVAVGYAALGVLFLRAWGKASDHLFLVLALGFDLLAINQAITTWIGLDERVSYGYILRVVAFTMVLIGVDNFLQGRRKRE